jgi:hypothetical protein
MTCANRAPHSIEQFDFHSTTMASSSSRCRDRVDRKEGRKPALDLLLHLRAEREQTLHEPAVATLDGLER